MNNNGRKLINKKLKNMKEQQRLLYALSTEVDKELKSVVIKYNEERNNTHTNVNKLEAERLKIKKCIAKMWTVNVHIETVEQNIKNTETTAEIIDALFTRIRSNISNVHNNNNNVNNNNVNTTTVIPFSDYSFPAKATLYKYTKINPSPTDLYSIIEVLKSIKRYHDKSMNINKLNDGEIHRLILNYLNTVNNFKILAENMNTDFKNTEQIYEFIKSNWYKNTHMLLDNLYDKLKSYKYIKYKRDGLRHNFNNILDICNKIVIVKNYADDGLMFENVLNQTRGIDIELNRILTILKSIINCPLAMQSKSISFTEMIRIISHKLGKNEAGKEWRTVIQRELHKQTLHTESIKKEDELLKVTLKIVIKFYKWLGNTTYQHINEIMGTDIDGEYCSTDERDTKRRRLNNVCTFRPIFIIYVYNRGYIRV